MTRLSPEPNALQQSNDAHLFRPFTLRGTTLKNRIMVSPMCQYSSEDGFANDWHIVNLGARATGGAALCMTEATAVVPEGRISPQDLGIWKDEHIAGLMRLTDFIRGQGSLSAIQLAHAGRKASVRRPWDGHGLATALEGGWPDSVVGPSELPFSAEYPMPQALSAEGIAALVAAFVQGAERALRAGFDIIELHAAHGYLFHEFLSPVSNHRTDEYGGSLPNRARFLIDCTRAVRRALPNTMPLLVRLSATDWLPEGEGLTVDDTVQVASWLRDAGADLIDVSSGGNSPNQRVIVGPSYQVPFAERIRREADIPVAAVGLITDPHQADAIIRSGQADVVALGRVLLRHPYWPLEAAHVLGHEVQWPVQYERARYQ